MVPAVNLLENELVAPPQFDGQKLPEDLAMNVRAQPRDVLVSLEAFFRRVVPAEASRVGEEQESWRVRATAFIDYVALAVEVQVYESCATLAASVVIFKHTSRNDAVRFRGLFSKAAQYFRSQMCWEAVADTENDVGVKYGDDTSFGFDDADFFMDSFDEADREPWSQRVELILQDAGSGSQQVREEALQALAWWAERQPECRAAMAVAFNKVPALIGRLLQAPSPSIAEMYPLSAAIKYAVADPADASQLVVSLLPLFTGLKRRPTCVEVELGQALESLRKTVRFSWMEYDIHDEDPINSVKDDKLVDNPSCASTRYSAGCNSNSTSFTLDAPSSGSTRFTTVSGYASEACSVQSFQMELLSHALAHENDYSGRHHASPFIDSLWESERED